MSKIFVRIRTNNRSIRGPVLGILLALVLSTICCARMQKAPVGTNDVCLRLTTIAEKPENFHCGYYALAQVIQYYRQETTEEDILTDSLLFVKANDTVSIFHCLKDNLPIPLTMKSERVDILLESVAFGNPVIVFMPADAFAFRGLNFFGTWMLHCIVVTGHDADETKVFFYSEGNGPYVVSREKFAKQWARVGNLCIIRAR